MNKLIWFGCALLLVTLSGGCTFPARQASVGHDLDARGSESAPASRAVIDLMERARSQSDGGEYTLAAATLERALRIEPSNPVLWHNLAVNHCRMKNYSQCESAAKRSLSFISPSSSLHNANWTLISQSRRLRGDTQGSLDAKRQFR
jgi:Tfp pilus assembly protein PilF